jgi:hypothetical protein
MESILLRFYGVSPDKIVARGGYLHIISPSSALDSLEANENLYTRTDKEVEAYNATLALLNEAESKGYGAIIARMSQ